MDKIGLLVIYSEYLKRLFVDKPEQKVKEHIKRFWLNIIQIKSYDLVSKKCLNPLFRDILKEFGIKKSVDFSDDLKQMYKENIFYFDENSDIKFPIDE